MSLAGFIAGPNDDVTRLFAWYGVAIADAIANPGDPFNTTGMVVMGKRSFIIIDNPNRWVAPDGTAFPWSAFVLTRSPRASVTKGETLEFFLRPTCDAEAVKQFFRKRLTASHTVKPRVITVDKNAVYPKSL